MSFHWTEEDLAQLQDHSLAQERIEEQLERFKRGAEPVLLTAPCTPSNGILRLTQDEVKGYADQFIRQTRYSTVKFVPASGAASRMFKHLFERDSANKLYQEFLLRVAEFPFYLELKRKLAEDGFEIDSLAANEQTTIISYLLESPGLGFAHLPKGAIPFHFTQGKSLTPFEEHVNEAIDYSVSNQKVKLHYTIGDAFGKELEDSLRSFAKQVSEENGCAIQLDFSKQYPETDTIAVDMANVPFRNEVGELVFRPGGHGALLSNLQSLDDDVIFVKNIDNVLPSNKRAEHNLYKRALAGYLSEIIRKRNALLKRLEHGIDAMKAEAIEFVNLFSFQPVKNLSPEMLRELLDRPIRVAGMVQNQGEPGGGPFWVEGADGNIQRQIIEKAQIDLSNPDQASIVGNSTHFNPVDLVCHFKNENGEKYNLEDFSDPSQAFITEKSMNGESLKALEHPGLWNGGMANWLTVFVEVPLGTFAPVKTVNDLLREAHR